MADTIPATERRKQHLTAAWATPLTMMGAASRASRAARSSG